MKEKLIRFLGHFFNVDETDGDTNFFELGYVNSLFGQQLVIFLENNFNITIEIEDMDIDNFSTINNIINFVNKKLSSK